MSSELKKLVTIIPVVLAVLTSVGGVLYTMNENIRSNGRELEKLRIKDYRQHRDQLRYRVEFLGASVADMESVLETDPDAFGPGGMYVLRQREKALDNARERLENYVEENKHFGSDD